MALPCGGSEGGMGPVDGCSSPVRQIRGRDGSWQQWRHSRAVDLKVTWALAGAVALLCGRSLGDMCPGGGAALLCSGSEGNMGTGGSGSPSVRQI
jgi:hypothetical protein